MTSCSNSEVNDKSLDTILWREKAVDAYRPVLRSHLSSLPLKNPQTFLNMSSFPRLTTSAVALTMRHHRPSIELVLRRQAHTRTFPPLFSSSSTFATAAAGRAHLSSSVVGGGTSSSSSKSRDRPVRRRQAAQSSRAVAIDNDVVTSPSWRRGKNEKERDGRSSGGGGGGLIPVRRSGDIGGKGGGVTTGGKKQPKFEYSPIGGNDGFDDRARAKLAALSSAREEAVMAMSSHDYDADELRMRRDQAGNELARAYSQAIKYTSRLTKSEGATRVAEGLLYEWMDMFVKPLGGSVVGNDDATYDDDGGTVTDATCLNKKWTIRTAHDIVVRLSSVTPASKLDDGYVVVDAIGKTDDAVVAVRVPPPSFGDYVNLLRAYSASKARRKGERCEALVKNMIALADALSRHYGDCEFVDKDDFGMEMIACGNGDEKTERWRTWVKESMPNSKVFALAIKVSCPAFLC